MHFGNRYLIIPIPGNSDEAMDPVRHLSALFSAVDCQPDSPAFSYITGRFIIYSMFTTRLKSLLGQARYLGCVDN